MTPEQEKKIRDLIGRLSGSDEGRALLGSALEGAGLAMLRLATLGNFPTCTDPDRLSAARTGIILDSETTGLEATDEVVELAMLRFRFDEQGILALDEVFNELREPGVPISEGASRVTGITAETVAGKRITDDQVAQFLTGAELVVAHNAGFDRPMVERTFPGAGFDEIAWHCSLAQVDWEERGKKGRSLESVVLSEGYVYGSHRADADVFATAFALNSGSEETSFSEMLRKGAVETIKVVAESYDFSETRNTALKNAGFRFSMDGSESLGLKKMWYKEVQNTPEETLAVSDLLRSREVFGKEMSLPASRVTVLNRYSGRSPATQERFRTAEFQTLREEAEARTPDQPSLF